MHETELLTYYLDVLLQMLSSPLGAIGLLAFLGLTVASVTVPNLRWALLVLTIYFATLPLIDTKSSFLPLAFPLEQFRRFSRPMIYVFSGLMLLPLLRTQRGWRRQLIGWPLLFFFVFDMFVSTRLMIFGNDVRGVLSVISYVLLLLALGLTVARSLQTYDDYWKVLWSISLAGGLVVLGTCYQLAINRTPIIAGNRLTGVTGNPQFLGIMIAYTLPFTCYLLTKRGTRAWVRPLLILQIAVTVVLLIWTGSRTGALSTGVGLLVAFHRRVGRFAIAGAVIAIVVLLLMPYFEGSQKIAARLLSTENTRGAVWNDLMVDVREHFWFGASREVFVARESSYLTILGQFGIFGALPLVFAGVALAVQLIQLRQLRRYLGSEAAVVDVVCGFWASVVVSSAFESLLLGVITFPVMMIYTTAALTTFLRDWSRAAAEAEQYAPPPDAMLAAA